MTPWLELGRVVLVLTTPEESSVMFGKTTPIWQSEKMIISSVV